MTRKIFARVATLVVAFAMVFSAFAVPVQAQTDAELAAQIQALLATIAALQAQISGGAVVTSCPMLTQPLTIGSQGTAVVDLQNYLTTTGHFTFSGGSTGYFGPITQQAVASWQAANGVAPAVGYWGPISLARYNQVCVVTPTPDGDDDDADDDEDNDLQGGEGSFTVTRGSASSAVVDLGDEEDLYSIEIEASDSDIEVNRIDFTFDARPWLYIDELMITVDGDEVATIDDLEDETTEVTSSEWRVRFSGLDIVIDEDDEVEVVLWAVTPSSLPGTRASDTVAVHVPDDGVRGVDGVGLIHYEPSSDLTSRSFTFDENFGLGSINVSSNSDSPESGIIVVSSTTETNGVEVLLFDVEADNGDVTVEEVYVAATTTTADADDIVSEVCLMNGSTEVDCATLTLATASITNRGVATGIVAGEYYALFDDLDFDMDEDEEVTFTLEASFNEADGTNYSTGDTVVFTAEQVGGINSDFENTSEAVTFGSGETFTLLTAGIFVEADSDDQDVSTMTDPGADGLSDQYRTYTLRFDVTSIDEDAYIFNSVGTTSTSGVQFNIMQGGSDITSTFTGTTTTSLSSSADLVDTGSNSAWLVEEGSTESFTVQVLIDPATAGFYGVELDVVEFDDETNDTESTYTELTVPDTADFQTDEANIDN